MDDDLRYTAYHEAGHAVAAYMLHIPFRYVTIIPGDSQAAPGETSLGHVMYGDFAKSFRPDIDTDLRTRDRIERHVMASFAGRVAEVKSGNEAAKSTEYTDDDQAVEWASYVAPPFPDDVPQGETELDHYLAWLYARTQNLFNLPWVWQAVEALALGLLDKGRLNRAEARQIIGSVVGY